MSDELPPPPVSNTRASQIAVNFAARVKHQMKDERKQVARFRTARRSLTTRPAVTHTPAHPHCPARGSGPSSRRSSHRRQCARWRSLCAGAAAVLTACCHTHTTPAREALATLLRASTHRVLRLTAHHPPFALCRAQRGQEARQGQGERRRGPHPAPVNASVTMPALADEPAVRGRGSTLC